MLRCLGGLIPVDICLQYMEPLPNILAGPMTPVCLVSSCGDEYAFHGLSQLTPDNTGVVKGLCTGAGETLRLGLRADFREIREHPVECSGLHDAIFVSVNSKEPGVVPWSFRNAAVVKVIGGMCAYDSHSTAKS